MAKFTLQSSVAGVIDWVSVVIPKQITDELGFDLDFVTSDGVRFPAYKHGATRSAGTSYRVLAVFPAEMVQGRFEAAEPVAHGELDQLEPHPSVLAMLADEASQPKVYGDVKTSQSTVEESPAEIVDRFVYSTPDWVVSVYRRIRHLHPVVDYGIRWSRRNKPGPPIREIL